MDISVIRKKHFRYRGGHPSDKEKHYRYWVASLYRGSHKNTCYYKVMDALCRLLALEGSYKQTDRLTQTSRQTSPHQPPSLNRISSVHESLGRYGVHASPKMFSAYGSEDSRGAKCSPELLTGSARGANMSPRESKVSSKRLQDLTLAALELLGHPLGALASEDIELDMVI